MPALLSRHYPSGSEQGRRGRRAREASRHSRSGDRNDRRLEIGQGTSVRMLIAKELEVVPNQVDLECAPPKERFSANAPLQALPTGNLNTIRGALRLLREVSATARVMLIAAAARRWGIDARLCHAYEGEVIHTPTWRKLKYGELAIDAAHMPIPREIALKGSRSRNMGQSR